jgi:hypothetical protein
MPSPTGRNAAKLYLPANFPRIAVPTGAYDAMPESMPPGYLARCCRWLRENGFSAEDCIDFIEHVDGGEGTSAADKSVSEAQHNAMERAAHQNANAYEQNSFVPGTGTDRGRDALPGYGKNHMPRPAIQAHDAACALAPGLANIKIGA